MPRVFIYILVVYVLISSAHAYTKSSDIQEQQIKEKTQKSAAIENQMQKELFKRSFAKRRKEHLEAVKNLRKTESYEVLYKMITVLADKMVTVVDASKDVLRKAGFQPATSNFPEEPNVRDALSTVLENTALFGDIILHIPHITHRILKLQQRFNETLLWSLNFTNQTRYLLDSGTLTMIHLVGQELNLTERDSTYFNPYWPSQSGSGKTEDMPKKKKSKKERQKRGPQMIKIDL